MIWQRPGMLQVEQAWWETFQCGTPEQVQLWDLSRLLEAEKLSKQAASLQVRLKQHVFLTGARLGSVRTPIVTWA